MTHTELNLQIATKVMGDKVMLLSEFLDSKQITHDSIGFNKKKDDGFVLDTGRPIPPYSVRLEEAYYVIAKMRSDGFTFSMIWEPGRPTVASFVKQNVQPLVKSVNDKPQKEYLFTGETPPITICLAALAAKTQPILQHGN